MQNASRVETFFEQRRSLDSASLAREVDHYRTEAAGTIDRLDRFAADTYGIEGVSQLFQEWWGKGSAPTICLARQLITWSTEQLAFSLVGEELRHALGYDWKILPFTGDCYGQHPYKESLVKIRSLGFRSDGSLEASSKVPRVNVIGDKERRGKLCGAEPRILSAIETDAGIFWGRPRPAMRLPAFHASFWKEITGKDAEQSPKDAGTLHNALLRRSMESDSSGTPSYFFREVEGRAVRCDVERWTDLTPEEKCLTRPPAQWYYFFYLSLFTTGERILFASLDDDKDVHAMFGIMEDVQRVTGKMPLIVAIPYKEQIGDWTLRFNEVNPTLLGNAWPPGHCIGLPKKEIPFFDRMRETELALSTPFS